MNDVEITKDFHIATPTKIGYNDKPIQRPWLLAEVEDAIWQARAAGADDATEVDLGYKGVTIKGLPAFPIEIPPAMRTRSTRQEPAPEPPATTKVLAIRAGVLLAALFVIPGLALALITVWRYTIGALS